MDWTFLHTYIVFAYLFQAAITYGIGLFESFDVPQSKTLHAWMSLFWPVVFVGYVIMKIPYFTKTVLLFILTLVGLQNTNLGVILKGEE